MSEVYKPGYLEVIFGPMKSGKSEVFIILFKKLSYSNHEWVTFKPAVNIREEGIASRAFNLNLQAIVIDENHPELIFEHLKGKKYKIIGIDEAQFFDDYLVDIVDTLLKQRYHVIVSGLMLNFRGEPFGPMPWLVGRANKVTRLTGICDVNECNRRATRTQRLINGEPASYDSPVVVIEGQGKKETYETRCVIHHIVPKSNVKNKSID
ncbi:MAG: thymidine kinase [Candidatus Heimdallarchaeota archaeon]|nr:MAG: thymidine kinase [Candidatus Heimdallarchaeota archaeon]